MKKITEKMAFTNLTTVCEEIAKGRYQKARQLFELTKEGKYPSLIAELAEAFGMMLVKVETREYRLEAVIDDLKKARADLADARERLARENVHLKQNLRDKFLPSRILGTSKGVRSLLAMVERVSHTSSNILITGETGTGKELVAKAIHYNSARCDNPFVAINCSAIPEAIFESEIFGIEKGVATGVEKRIGKIEQANGGTFFLDEIGDMPAALQAKMLRAIDDDRIERVGGRKSIPVDIRIVAATNKDLKKEVEKGAFREDLFYRLNVINLHMPPLRERKDDIRLLANHFLAEAGRRIGRPKMTFSPQAMEGLMAYPWPGNVRELENEIERATILAPSLTIGVDDLSAAFLTNSSGRTDGTGLSIKSSEQELMRKVLSDAGGNRSKAAKLLGISREGLRKKMKRYGMG